MAEFRMPELAWYEHPELKQRSINRRQVEQRLNRRVKEQLDTEIANWVEAGMPEDAGSLRRMLKPFMVFRLRDMYEEGKRGYGNNQMTREIIDRVFGKATAADEVGPATVEIHVISPLQKVIDEAHGERARQG